MSDCTIELQRMILEVFHVPETSTRRDILNRKLIVGDGSHVLSDEKSWNTQTDTLKTPW